MLALLAIFFQCDDAYAGNYQLKDLESLEAQNNFREYLEHALDILPSKRNSHWEQMTKAMAEKYTEYLFKKPLVTQKDFNDLNKLSHWPVLQNDEFFGQNRSQISFKYLSQCLKKEKDRTSGQCHQDLRVFWSPEKQDLDLAYSLYQLFSPYLSEQIDEWFFFAKLLRSSLAPLYCKREEIRKIVWDKVKQDQNLILNDQIHSSCLLEMEKMARSYLQSNKNEDRKTGYLILKISQKLTQNDKDIYYFYYLLDTPGPGETFNLSWNNLKELKKHPARREELVNTLKQSKILPSKILGSFDEFKKKVILRNMAASIPEYLNFYSHTCLEFYAGLKSFPEGSPALHCRELFNLAKVEKNILPQQIIKAFYQNLE